MYCLIISAGSRFDNLPNDCYKNVIIWYGIEVVKTYHYSSKCFGSHLASHWNRLV